MALACPLGGASWVCHSLGFVIPKEFLNPILTEIGEVP